MIIFIGKQIKTSRLKETNIWKSLLEKITIFLKPGGSRANQATYETFERNTMPTSLK